MPKTRRAALIRLMTRAALLLVLLDAVLYFGVVRSLGSAVNRQRQSYAASRRRVLEQQARLVRLEQHRTNLIKVDEQVRNFLQDHVLPRRQGYSHAARLVRVLTRQAGLQLTGVSYRMEPDPSEPLQKLGIEVNVEGSFKGVLNFAHSLETADDFIVLRDFNFISGDAGALQLRVGADLYLTP